MFWVIFLKRKQNLKEVQTGAAGTRNRETINRADIATRTKADGMIVTAMCPAATAGRRQGTAGVCAQCTAWKKIKAAALIGEDTFLREKEIFPGMRRCFLYAILIFVVLYEKINEQLDELHNKSCASLVKFGEK